MKIYLGSDHAGFQLKEELKMYLSELGYEIEDCGNTKLQPEDDYPDFICTVAKALMDSHEESRGIILGGSGEGEAMVANRCKGIRAAVWYGGEDRILTLSREHNNANVLSIGARFVDEAEAKRGVKMWLETPFSNEERHQRRIDKIDVV